MPFLMGNFVFFFSVFSFFGKVFHIRRLVDSQLSGTMSLAQGNSKEIKEMSKEINR